MNFKPYAPDPHSQRRNQGSMKVTVVESSNGRSQIRLSAAVRDYLEPSKPDPEAQYPDNQPQMFVELLIDQEAGMFMLQRVPGDDGTESTFRVGGLTHSGSAYITGWGFGAQLHLKPGRYLCQPAENDGARAVVFGHSTIEKES